MLEQVGFAQQVHHEEARQNAYHVRQVPVLVVTTPSPVGPHEDAMGVLHEQDQDHNQLHEERRQSNFPAGVGRPKCCQFKDTPQSSARTFSAHVQ